MAGSFSTVKVVSTLIVNVGKRGFAAAATQAQSTLKSGAPNVMLKRGSKESAWWGPDPVTGYYRPENQVKETDAAKLPQILASNAIKATPN